MPGGLFPRVKTWTSTEDVTASDLNAEFDNIINNLLPGQFDDYEATVGQMQNQTDPGEVGTESQATTLAGEIERLRFILHEITGKTYWYQSPSTSLNDLAAAIGTGITPNRLASGRVRAASQQPIFLVPNGTAKTIKLDGTPTPFVYYVDGIAYTISTDVTLTGLTSAPSINNTALVNNVNLTDQVFTKTLGEDGTEIAIDTVGSEISGLAGKIAAFKIFNGTDNEYFVAEVGTNKLINAKRGFFFDSADAPIPRIVFSNNDVITLMNLTWVFAKIDGTLTISYTNPTYSADEPTSPSINDYWFDVTNQTWMRFDISSFIAADATLVGICIQNTTATVGARSFEFFLNYGALNTVEVIASNATQVKSHWTGSQINVWGSAFRFDQGFLEWDITTDLESGVSENPSTLYYLYVTEQGDTVISDIKPYNRLEDLNGLFHPYNSWRCVGTAYNNSSSNFTAISTQFSRYDSIAISPSSTALGYADLIPQVISLDPSAGNFNEYLPSAAGSGAGTMLRLLSVSEDGTITLFANGTDTIAGETEQDLEPGAYVELLSDGISNWILI